MYPEGVERLFHQVPIGTRVTAVDQRVKVGWHGGELYLEAQPDMDQLDELEATQSLTPRPPVGDVRQQVLDRAGTDAGRIDWTLVEAELASRRGIPVQITRPGPARVSGDNPLAAPASGLAMGADPAAPIVVRRGVTESIY
jgi:L,D-transpeptidase ErfK/SrfK